MLYRAARRAGRIVVSMAVIVLLTIAGLEIALRLFDPHGIRYFDDLGALYAAARPDPSGFSLPAGDYAFSHWSMRIDDAGRRVTPAANPAGRRVLFYGDSAAACWGVDDSDCWINIVADRLNLNGLNYGRNAYSAANIAALVDATAGDSCAVVLGVNNDMDYPAEHFVFGSNRAASARPFIVRYIDWFIYRAYLTGRGAIPEQPEYAPAMRRLVARSNTLVLAYGDYGAAVAERFGVVPFKEYSGRISIADPHPNELGNMQIADEVTPIIQRWLDGRACG